MGIHTSKNGRAFYFHCNTASKQNVLLSHIFLSQRYSVILELAFILCFDHCEVLNPFVPQSKKIFWFYSRKPVNNEASRDLFILSMIYFFLISVSMLIQFKMQSCLLCKSWNSLGFKKRETCQITKQCFPSAYLADWRTLIFHLNRLFKWAV